MGARTVFKVLLADNTSWTAGFASAGEPTIAPDGTLPGAVNLTGVPLMHACGTTDYDGSSALINCTRTQNATEAVGVKSLDLVYINGTGHNDMATDAAFTPSMYEWISSWKMDANGTRTNISATNATTTNNLNQSSSSSNADRSRAATWTLLALLAWTLALH